MSVELRLVRGEDRLPASAVTGDEAKPDEPAARVAAGVEKRLTEPTPKK